MVWGANSQFPKHHSKILFGFNEPDHPKQSNISPAVAFSLWEKFNATTLISPVMAGDPTKNNSWLKKFISLGAKFDAIAVHQYGHITSKPFIQYIQNIHNTFPNYSLLITEFSPQTHADATAHPHRFNQSQVNTFFMEVMRWFENTTYIAGYAVHDPKIGTCAIFYPNGTLTPTGKVYGKFK